MSGAICRQGPHHDAEKFSNTTSPAATAAGLARAVTAAPAERPIVAVIPRRSRNDRVIRGSGLAGEEELF
jgi:hypothetical protein